MNDLSHNINVSLTVKNRLERERFDFAAEVERANKSYGVSHPMTPEAAKQMFTKALEADREYLPELFHLAKKLEAERNARIDAALEG